MSKASAGLCTYFMKTVYGKLPIVIRKRLYNKHYSGVLCLHYSKVEFSDHVFTCCKESDFHKVILFKCISCWKSLAGFYFLVSSVVVESLLSCLSDVSLYALFCKDFVLAEWFEEIMQIFNNHKEATQILVDFVYDLDVLYCSELWGFRFRFRVNIERDNLVGNLKMMPVVSIGLLPVLLNDVVRLIGIDDSFGISFGFHKPYLFFFGLGNRATVYIKT
ncbi:hypothetical protein G9A89_011888 [Geosiphon pyriformis]|nr:hypothetical protein G9A89_011888 [Geosiphon pyriformis]